VTGANRGIGNAIVKELCDKFDGDVILTSRDVARGLAAVEELNKKGCFPKYHQLDIDDETSILAIRDYLKENYGGLDVLVNNAGIFIPWTADVSDELFAEQASQTVNTNFFGTRRNSNILFPLLRPHARVVNLSSVLGHLIMIDGQSKAAVDLRAKLASNELTDDQLVEIMRQFLE
jgi:carbonyl reductase 1